MMHLSQNSFDQFLFCSLSGGKNQLLMCFKYIRKRLENTERLLEPVPIIGTLTGSFLFLPFKCVQPYLVWFLYVGMIYALICLFIFFFNVFANVQQRLWSSSLELKHGTLTCQVHDIEDMCGTF